VGQRHEVAQAELTQRCKTLGAFQEKVVEYKRQMEGLKEGLIKEIHELVETESKRGIGPLFETDAEVKATCALLKVEFGAIEKRFEDLRNLWHGKRSSITERFDKELLELMEEMEANKTETLK
jgi:hypothetical protein